MISYDQFELHLKKYTTNGKSSYKISCTLGALKRPKLKYNLSCNFYFIYYMLPSGYR